jgi:quercetin dioxygenase-like cupin family protein
MLKSGDELVDGATGMRLLVRHAASETSGRFVEWEAAYPPGSPEPPVHFHPNQWERFEVLEGAMVVRLDGVVRTLRAGDRLEVPPGTPHSMWNGSAESTRLLWRTEPALRTEDFFAAAFSLGRRRRTGGGKPGILPAIVLAAEFRNEFRVVRPPRPIQFILFLLLAPIGRLLGHRVPRN